MKAIFSFVFIFVGFALLSQSFPRILYASYIGGASDDYGVYIDLYGNGDISYCLTASILNTIPPDVHQINFGSGWF